MTRLPGPVRRGVSESLAQRGLDPDIVEATPVSGGCINHGARVRTGDGATFFLKWNATAPPGMFEAEADGLQALAEPDVLRVPAPIARGGDSGSPAWLLMEHVEAGTPGEDYEALLGRGLALLHARGGADARTFGWARDNWIGSLDQANDPSPSWGAFWRDRRLAPQLAEARRRGFLRGEEGRALDEVVERAAGALEDTPMDGPHLLHGDLWSGNVYAQASGAPVLVDPAVYRGHGEVDLAMTELFGGFGATFYAAYAEVLPVPEAYRRWRRDLYQLYYLLVHVNLFGAPYLGRTLETARRVAGVLA